MESKGTTQKYYFKATRANGVSGYDDQFHYKLGLNVHPAPDKSNDASCGIGIHLAKTLTAAQHYVPRATEYYLAKAGVILGEDTKKIRCDSCFLIRQISQVAVTRLLAHEAKVEQERIRVEREKEKERKRIQRERAERERRIREILNTQLVDKEWLKAHLNDYSDAFIKNFLQF